MAEPLRCAVVDRSQVGEARRRAAELARATGLEEVPREKVAVIVTELATNLVKHAGGGELIVRELPGRAGIEVLAIDHGAGMADVEGSFRDGRSTAGTSGSGLGAVRRLASVVDAYSSRPGGTVIVAQVAGDRAAVPCSGWDVGVVSLAKAGEEICGDGWALARSADGACHLVVVDGLGHGIGAADAARMAVKLFDDDPDLPPVDQVTSIHHGLRGTRGAAVAVARVDPHASTVGFAGIGNVAAVIAAGDASRQLVSMNGTAGHEVPRIREFGYPWVRDALLLMHTDGITTRWDLGRYPGLSQHHPSLVAGVLFRDFNRGRDDATVVVVRAAA